VKLFGWGVIKALCPSEDEFDGPCRSAALCTSAYVRADGKLINAEKILFWKLGVRVMANVFVWVFIMPDLRPMLCMLP